jgi:hypothetical protein
VLHRRSNADLRQRTLQAIKAVAELGAYQRVIPFIGDPKGFLDEENHRGQSRDSLGFFVHIASCWIDPGMMALPAEIARRITAP